jgi:hypothetical protein
MRGRGFSILASVVLCASTAGSAEEEGARAIPRAELTAHGDAPARVEAPVGWDANNWVCPGLECRRLWRRRWPRLVECAECRKPTKPLGICGACARKKRACRFCARPFPHVRFFPCRYNNGKRMTFSIRVSNKGDAPLRLIRVGPYVCPWRIVFTARNGSRLVAGLVPARLAPPLMNPRRRSLEVAKGRSTRVRVMVETDRSRLWNWVIFRSESDWAARKAPRPLIKAIPPGTYDVTAVYEHAAHAGGERCGLWHGRIETKPVRVVIGSAAKKNGRARRRAGPSGSS